MRLKNKKTGEIREYGSVGATTFGKEGVLEAFAVYDSLAELNEEWEDVPEEPKKYWYITGEGYICRDDIKYSDWIEERKSIGNYFGSREEAEKAVEKLKAFKRLKDKGFVFEYYILDSGYNKIIFDMPIENEQDLESSRGDLDLLFFGGKDE